MRIENESDTSQLAVSILTVLGGDVQRHEDKCSTGIPDLSYGLDGAGGWIELKHIRGDMLITDLFECRHFTKDQQKWLRARGKASGYCFLWSTVHLEGTMLLISVPWHCLPSHKETSWREIAENSDFMVPVDAAGVNLGKIRKVLTGGDDG